MTYGCPSETRQVRMAPVEATDAGADFPESPKTGPQDICLVYPQQHANLKAGRRNGPQAHGIFEKAHALAEAGEHSAALSEFDNALAADPYHGLSHLGAAESHLYTDNDVNEMRRHLAAAVILLPTNPRAHLRLAELAIELRDRALALTHLRCALQLKPTYAEARFMLARQLAASDRNSEAEIELTSVINTGYEVVSSRVLMAQVLEAQGRLLEAAQQIEAAARHVRTSAALYRRAAKLYVAADSPLFARRMKRLADRLDPPPRARRMRPLKKRKRRKKK